MTGSDLPGFDITAPLPTGTTVLEASAGTGKTWTIGALVTRYVAEGAVTLPELLVITFGRAASREMRERVRDQLVAAEEALSRPDEARGGPDALIGLLADAPDDEVRRRRARLRVALADFDGATIATTHQFCQTVLRSLGTAGDSDGSADLTDDLRGLVDQIVDDLYVAKYAREDDPVLTHEQARALAHAVVADPHASLVPDDVDPTSGAGVRVRFAQVVRRRLDQRKRELGLLDHDDLLKRLETVLEQPDSPARDLMRRRWKVVLVDEFQDTDPVQWNILDRAFRGHATLVLIGDPKQAIYAFRGGDVFTYLRAADTASVRRTLPVNWRSDAPLVDALTRTFAGARLGHPDIAVRPVTARRAGSRLRDLPHPAPFRLRVVQRDPDHDAPSKELAIGPVRDRIAADLAADVAELLASSATYDPGDGLPRPIAAGDVAVLVATASEADLVRRTFARHGIAAVLGGGSNVLVSSAADDWLALLEAMEAPQRSGLVRAAALTDLMGHDVTGLVAGGDALTDEIATRVRDLADLLAARGVAAVVETLTDEAFSARILARPDGYRRMTDLRHVAHLLHEVALREHLGLSGLVQWLRRQRSERGESPELTRRLDSDAKAVQVLTIHASKGLEFPIVHLPFLFNRWRPDREERPRFHDAVGARILDVGGPGHPDFAEHSRQAQAEDAGEVLRLAYVAMTRAKSQLVAWWAPTRDARNAGLHRLLFRGDLATPDVPERAAVPDDATALAVLRGWQDAGGPTIEIVTDRVIVPPTPAGSLGDLAVRRFDRDLDTAWRRTSYTGLTREDDAPHVGTEMPDEDATTDEVELVVPETTAADGRTSPMADLPKGATFGSLVHGVLEDVDVASPDLPAELRERVVEQLTRWPVDLDVDATVAAFEAILSTPLGPLADDHDLRALLAERQWKELDFEIPLGGGDRPGPTLARLADVADLLDRHMSPDDPIRPFAARLRSPGLADQSLRGYLTGSIDLALRLPSGRFLVVDHKTNWLGPTDAPLTIAGYRPDALATAMNSGTYPLQALLYAVVLHRFLRWRLRGYEPEQHLGGVLYLYVRGMVGADAPRVEDVPYGVFSWRPPAALVTDLSDLLDGPKEQGR